MSEIARLPTPANPGDDRQLPRNIEAEAAFLGAILIDNRVVEDLPVQLTAAHFFEPLHGRIFAQTMALIERNSIARSEEHTSELQSLMRISYAVYCLKKKKTTSTHTTSSSHNY